MQNSDSGRAFHLTPTLRELKKIFDGWRSHWALPAMAIILAVVFTISTIPADAADDVPPARVSQHQAQGLSDADIDQADDVKVMRVFVVLDDSGSMRRGNRFAFAVAAVRRWLDNLDLGCKTTIELVAASDHITYAADQEESLSAMTKALEEMKPKRYSRTLFRTIDAELADYVASRARPDEEVTIAIISDGLSDEPGNDLALLDLGDQMVAIGGGVFASLSSHFPGVEAFAGSESSAERPHKTATTRPRSRLRRLLPTSIRFTSRVRLVSRTLRAKFIKGYEGTTIDMTVVNDGELPRLLQLRAQGPQGMLVNVDPASVVLEGHGRATANLVVSASDAIAGEIVVTAEAADGTAAHAAVEARLAVDRWSSARIWALTLVLGGLLAGALVVWLLGRRRLAIAPAGQTDPVVELRRGDVVPIATLAPSFPAGVSLGRGWLGLYVTTSGAPVSLGGVPIGGAGKARYRLRTDIETGEVTVVLDRFNQNHVSSAFFSASPMGSPDGLL